MSPENLMAWPVNQTVWLHAHGVFPNKKVLLEVFLAERLVKR